MVKKMRQWFLPGPMEVEPDYLLPGPRAEPRETAVLDDWRKAEAGNAARLARVAGRVGALDDRLKRGPEGWRHRLALIEAADLSWFVGDRIGPDRLALWISMRLSGVQDDTAALARVGWAVRRLTGGPGPEVDLSAFLDRRDPENLGIEAEPFADRAGGWLDLMAQAADLHPITRACVGFHLWSLAGLGQQGDRMEAAVTAARFAASEGKGAVVAPLAMGGAGGLLTEHGRARARLPASIDAGVGRPRRVAGSGAARPAAHALFGAGRARRRLASTPAGRIGLRAQAAPAPALALTREQAATRSAVVAARAPLGRARVRRVVLPPRVDSIRAALALAHEARR